jgi:hypothetical protein
MEKKTKRDSNYNLTLYTANASAIREIDRAGEQRLQICIHNPSWPGAWQANLHNSYLPTKCTEGTGSRSQSWLNTNGILKSRAIACNSVFTILEARPWLPETLMIQLLEKFMMRQP